MFHTLMFHNACNSRKKLETQGGKTQNSIKKLKTQGKNSRFRQNQKRGLPKIGRKKKADVKASAKLL